jgi:hypothetical protein
MLTSKRTTDTGTIDFTGWNFGIEEAAAKLITETLIKALDEDPPEFIITFGPGAKPAIFVELPFVEGNYERPAWHVVLADLINSEIDRTADDDKEHAAECVTGLIAALKDIIIDCEHKLASFAPKT